MVTDFIYDGLRLSNLGYDVVSFGKLKNEEIDTDSQFSYNHLSMMRGKRQPFINSVYEDPLKMEFYIAKSLCVDGEVQTESEWYNISVSDMAYLKRWLVRPTPHKLTIPNDEYNGIFWNGTFTLEEYVLGDKRIGAKLTFECDADFGYYDTATITGTLEANGSRTFNCTSDEIGWLYPDMTITLKEDGDLQITNSSDSRVMSIKNCEQDEVITITKNMQISSSLQSHNIANDFNYRFYRINNSFRNVANSISSNLAINYTISYNPIAKAVIV